MRFPSLRRHSRFARDLDAYVDGELAHARVRELELHLARCVSCARIVEERQLLKRMAAALPEVAAPRSFRITAEMVAARPVAGARSAAPQRWQLNLARGAAAIAIFGLVATVTVDLAGGGTNSNSTASSANGTNLEAAGDAAAAKSSASGSAAAGQSVVPSGQSVPAVPTTSGVPNAAIVPPAASTAAGAPRSSGIDIGPAGGGRTVDATALAGGARPAVPATGGSDRPPYHLFEAGLRDAGRSCSSPASRLV